MKTSLAEKKFVLSIVKEAVESGARQVKCTDLLGLSERTYQRWMKDLKEDKRQGPKMVAHKLSLEEKELILTTCNLPENRNLSPEIIVAKLADEGSYIASERSFYRVLKEHGQLAKRGKERARKKHEGPLALVATTPNQVWSWDITYLKSPIKGEYYFLYMVMDIYSRMIVGFKVAEVQCSEIASKLIRKSCEEQGIKRQQLYLHADNGGPMKGATMLSTLQKLGVIPSFNRPAVSDDNPYSESLFKTLKYRPGYPSKGFKSLEDATVWTKKFVVWYNDEHLHSEIKFVTPSSRHKKQDKGLLKKRASVYEQARAKNPQRWKNKVRNWNHVEAVALNPHGKLPKKDKQLTMAMKVA